MASTPDTLAYFGKTLESIGKSYVSLIKSKANGHSTCVVFDSYNRSPKDHEHERRTAGTAGGIEILVIPINACPVSKNKFLSNVTNKSNFILYLCGLCGDDEIQTEVANDDCDTTIIKKAIMYANCDPQQSVEILAEDTDILVLLLHHSTSVQQNLFFTTNKGTYNVTELFNNLSDKEKSRLLFLHAFTGCDTVSAIYRHTKVTL